MKKHTTTIILILVLIVGLSFLLYPVISDYWNSFRHSKAIASYVEKVSSLKEEDYAKIINDAKKFNESSRSRRNLYSLNEEETALYNSLLNVDGTGIMGYVEIPSLSVSLPIYHGIDDTVLQVGVGHMEWTSLPVGGEGTHTVLSGHRGLPSAKLFSDLDKMAEGDVFILKILNETLTYQVDQILIVKPNQSEPLKPEGDKDLCTLLTCTPYGINSHRLLVRGHRIENAKEDEPIHITNEATQIEPMIIAPMIAMPILLVLLIILIIPKKRKNGGDYFENEE